MGGEIVDLCSDEEEKEVDKQNLLTRKSTVVVIEDDDDRDAVVCGGVHTHHQSVSAEHLTATGSRAGLRFRAHEKQAIPQDILECIALDAHIDNVVGREAEEGSSYNFIFLDSSCQPNMISRQHAQISFSAQNKCWTVTDLDSKNGLLLNGRRITHAEIKHGMRIRLSLPS